MHFLSETSQLKEVEARGTQAYSSIFTNEAVFPHSPEGK